MKVRIEKGKAKGQITAPSSKSMAHRLLIAAALAEGVSTVRAVSMCEDVLATVDCLTALGAKFEASGEDILVRGLDMGKTKPMGTLFCRESGSTLRFLLPISMLSGNQAVFKGADGLMRRPMAVYETLSAEKGLTYVTGDNSITVCGPLTSGEYMLPGNVSSQFISGLLFALPLVEGDSIIRLTTQVESRSYIDLTIDALRTFGVCVVWKDTQTLQIQGGQTYCPSNVTVEGDASGAAFPDALNLFGGEVSVCGLAPNSIQGDGIYPKLFTELDHGTPTISIGDCPDLAPILFAIAAAKNGGVFLDTKRLKIKESDRAEVMAEELRKFGAEVTVNENSVVIEPSAFCAPSATLCGHNDHRIVMALSVLCTVTGGEIDGAEAVAKSYPAFFDHLRQLGIEVKEQ